MADRKRFGGLTVGWRFMSRQLRSNPAVVIASLATVLLAGLFLATTPRALEQIADETLQDSLSSSSPAERNIEVHRAARLAGTSIGDDPLDRVRVAGERFAELEMSPLIQSIISDQSYVIDSPQFGVFPMPGRGSYSQGRSESRGSESVCPVCSDYLPDEGPFPSFVRFRLQERIEDKAKLVAGSMPTRRDPLPMLLGTECPSGVKEREEFEESDEVDCALEAVPVYEVAMTAETLSVLSFGLGDMVVLKPDLDDPLFSHVETSALDYQLVLSVSGVIELPNSDEEYWYGDPRLHRASIAENPDFRIIFATGLLNSNAYQRLLLDLNPADWQYSWRYFVDTERTAAVADVRDLAADFHNLEVGFKSSSLRSSEYSVVTSLRIMLDEYLAQRGLVFALMSMALSGVLAISIGLILELGGLVTTLQRSEVVAARNRGASRGQLTLTKVYQGLIVTVPSAAFGYLVAERLFPESEHLLSYRATVALALGATAAFVLVSVPLIYGRLGSLQKDGAVPDRRPGLRQVGEFLAIALAVGSVILLRRRAQIDQVASTDSMFDPLLAAAPALLGVAVGLLTLRLYPFLIRGAAWLVSRRRGVVAFVGFRRILQQAPIARWPLVVILLAVSVATFSTVVRSSIDEGQQSSAWQAVGADYTVTGIRPGSSLLTAVDVSGIDDVEATAFAARYPDARVAAHTSGLVEFLSVELDAYTSVNRESVADSDVPEAMLVEPVPDGRTPDVPIPVIISSYGWQPQRAPVLGDRFLVNLGTLEPHVVVVEVRDRFPGLPLDRPFVVADMTSMDSLSDPLPVTPTILYIRAPESAGVEIASTVHIQSKETARFSSRYEKLSDVADSPLIAAVDRVLVVTFGLSTVFAIVAAISSLAISSAVRRRDLGYLRTLGLRTRQATGMTLIEQVPLVLTAVAVGSLVGVATVILLQPTIHFAALTGGLLSTNVEYDPLAIIAMAASLVAALAVSVAIFILVNRREDLSALLKVGDG